MSVFKKHAKFPGVFWVTTVTGSEILATKNLAPGKKVYGEKLIEYELEEYRLWNSYRSKLAAAIKKGINVNPITPGSKVLYLGAASGTTASHVSDIVGERGFVYCVEFSSRVARELVKVCETRENMMPILADARNPVNYRMLVEQVDIIYQDVAQPYQAAIMIDNASIFLKDGWGILAIKSRSIDVTKKPKEVYKTEIDVLKDYGFKIITKMHLEPFDKSHALVIAKL